MLCAVVVFEVWVAVFDGGLCEESLHSRVGTSGRVVSVNVVCSL